MKKLTIIFILISTICNAQVELAEDYSFKQDKKMHVGAGIGISAGAFLFVHNKTNDVNLAFRSGVFSASIAGLGKEISGTISGKEFSIADLGYTFLGGLGTSYLMKRIVIRRNKKQAKRDKLLRAFLADI